MHECAPKTKLKQFSVLAFFLTGILSIAAAAQNDEIKIPEDVKPFVQKGLIPIALESGDLNADGRKDHILVTSEIVAEDAAWEEGAGERSVLILVREAGGELRLAARNDLAALCRNCGGVFGDPFAGVDIRGTRFTVNNYGGSNDRWSYSYTFDYSRRDKTWQLVRVEDESFHTLDPKHTTKRRVYTPPKDFGLINFAVFDPDKFMGKGKK
ncbi:MAG: hypothetical protein ACJ72Z_08425 [Pyrinomonadaceae bacterium]